MASTLSPRLTSTARREQLLDAAAELVTERGVGAITMEGLAVRAQVSKALPYKHFENAEAVLVELYRREMGNLGAAVLAAVATSPDPRVQLSAAIHAYFDVVIQRGALLANLSGPGSEIPQMAHADERLGPNFLAGLFMENFGTPKTKASIAASLLLGALLGAVEALAAGEASRARLEAASVGLALHLIGVD